MKLEYVVRGVRYMPLRAAPVVTSGLLDVATLSSMIVDPEGWYETPNYEKVICPFAWKPSGGLLPVPRSSFLPLINRIGKAPLFGAELLPPGMVVETDAVKDKFNVIVNEIAPRYPERVRGRAQVWDLSPILNKSALDIVLAGLKPPRSNNAAVVCAEILAAVTMIEAACNKAGHAIDRHALPGTKADWRPVFNVLAPSTKNHRTTSLDPHFAKANIQWRQGLDQRATKRWAEDMKAAGYL